MEKLLFMIRHDAQGKTYSRAGLVFYKESQPYEITAEQLAILQDDPRIVMHEVLTPKNAARVFKQRDLSPL